MSSLVIFIVAAAALATGAVLGALVAQLRAVWRIVIVSALESKPISCVPGFAPARLEPTSTGSAYPARFMSPTSESNVPDGASSFAE